MIRVTQTPAIQRQLKAIMGKDADLTGVAVYEMIAIGSSPLNADGIYHGAVVTEKAMKSLAAKAKGRPVPMIDTHNSEQGLPVGRLLHSAVVKAEDGKAALHSLVYLTISGQEDRISKLDSGILRDVSVGFTPSSLTCSSCSYDFLASSEGRSLLRQGYWNNAVVCPNKHVMGGPDGTKLQVDNARSWKETSFVTRGASEEGRILSAEFQKLSLQDFKVIPLAASEDDDTLFCNTNDGEPFDIVKPHEEPPMDFAAMKSEVELRVRAEEALKHAADTQELASLRLQVATIPALTTQVAEVATLTTQVATLTTERDTAQTSLAAADARIAILKANKGLEPSADDSSKSTTTAPSVNADLYKTF
jgi:hypothetical protein